MKTVIRPEAEMKYSNVHWIGNIPRDWYIRPLKSLYYLTTGFTPNSKDDALYDENGEVWVTIGDLKGSLVTDSKQKISAEVAKMHIKEMTKKGSLMYSFKLSVGTVAFAGKDLFTNEAIASLWPKNDLGNLNYLKYASSLIIGNANTNIYGAFIMNQQLILNAPLPVPMKNEQQAIADYLDDKCSKIDEIIAEAKASINEYKELKQSVITNITTHGLRDVSLINSSNMDIGMIPDTWNICKTLYGLAMPITDGPHVTPELLDDGIAFISAEAVSCGRGSIDFNHMRGYISEEFYNECCKKYVPQRDDIYMIKSGATTGTVSIVDTDRKFTIWSPLAVFRVNRDRLNPRYLFYFLQSKPYQQQVQLGWTFGTQQNIGMRTLEQLKICLPPLGEQAEIVEYLDNKLPQIDSLIAEKESLIKDLEAYKKSLIYEVVTGKRRVV